MNRPTPGKPPSRAWLNPNTALALAGFLVCAAVFYASRNYPPAPLELGGPPAFYPRVLAVVLALLCVAAFVEGLLRPPRASLPSGTNLLRLLGVVALLATTPIALGWLGFRLMGALVAFMTMLLLSDWPRLSVKTVLGYLFIAGLAALTVHFVLETIARVPLPRGRLF